MRTLQVLIALLAIGAAGCASDDHDGPLRDPSEVAPPTEAELARKAEATEPASAAVVSPSPDSTSRPLAYVNGDVITYREVLTRVGPQLAALRIASERKALEEQSLMQIVRQRVVYQAAVQASVPVHQSEVEGQVQENLHDLERTGATLEAYLRERGLTRREYEESIRREMASQKFMLAAIGRNAHQGVRVRPRADTYVSPAEVKKYYERHPAQFRHPATARVRMLVVKTDFLADDREQAVRAARKHCAQARERLAAGEDWVPVYREMADRKEGAAPLDGLLTIRKGEKAYAPWIEEFGFTQEAGTLSAVIQQGSTFVLLYSEGATEARLAPYSEVQDDVRQKLSQLKRVTASYEVELQLLQQASVQPESVRSRLRAMLRDGRRKALRDGGK